MPIDIDPATPEEAEAAMQLTRDLSHDELALCHLRANRGTTDDEALALVMNVLQRIAETATDGLHDTIFPEDALCSINNLARDTIDALAARRRR